MLVTEKSYETFPKHNIVGVSSESFALNLIISVPNNCLPHYNVRLNKIFS